MHFHIDRGPSCGEAGRLVRLRPWQQEYEAVAGSTEKNVGAVVSMTSKALMIDFYQPNPIF